MNMNTTLQIVLPMLALFIVIYLLKPKKPEIGTLEHDVQKCSEKVIVEHITKIEEPIDEDPYSKVSTMEELINEGLTPQQARMEIRAQQREIRDHQKMIERQENQTRRELVQIAKTNRDEERAKARLRTQQARFAFDIGKAVLKGMKKRV